MRSSLKRRAPRQADGTARWAACARLVRGFALVLLLLPLVGCSTLSYYWQAVKGHGELIAKAQPIPDVIAQAQTPEALKQQLRAAQEIRAFASDTLHLPHNSSYTRYADLGRSALLWNVVATPALSLRPTNWCFPIAGCVSYKGFFDKEMALSEAKALREQGLEVSVYPVPAYSTLGWSNALGGDPLLNTFMGQSQANVARLIFHELAHQKVYVQGDSAFNEAFATAVERLGGQQWLSQKATPAVREQDEKHQRRRQMFQQLTHTMRATLQQIYQDFETGRISQAQAQEDKRLAFASFRSQFQTQATAHPDLSVYASWVAQANNASFASQATYEKWVPAFVRLFEQSGRQWPTFYQAVEDLAALSPEQRQNALRQHLSAAPAEAQ